jgi:type I restriction-modification system DNA methylase subunit
MRKEARTGRHKIRFVIATDFKLFLAVDTKTGDTLDIEFKDLAKKFDFFLPWAGMEKAVYQGENPADVKAAEKLAKLFDEIKADNFDTTTAKDFARLHELNVFLSRLLFCFFAEDTKIFADNQFSDAISSHTNEDGSDLADYLKRLFTVLNQAESNRPGLPDYLSSFPYVNGGLFKDDIQIPAFSRKSRKILIECGAELDWSDINPDIFGSMFQAVVHTEQRSNMGQHYTSVPNIMKVIEPLFLNDLYEELDKHQDSQKKLLELQQRIGKIKIFDPACGSGNFLIIAYKELRKLEMEILKRLQELEFEKSGQMFKPFSVIQLSQFYGIEIDDFAHEVAILSLWLTEHQMNVVFKDEFGESLPSLPLKNGGNIVCGNATIMNWLTVCPSEGEVYLLGNPPYLGSSMQTKEQKNEMDKVFKGFPNYKNLDYVSCWFKKGSDFIEENKNASYAFVATNSISQGEQPALLWPYIFNQGLEIEFAHQPFLWSNNAKHKAAVFCVIVGVKKANSKNKKLYSSGLERVTKAISPYLTSGSSTVIHRRSKPLSNMPKMLRGDTPTDNGFLSLDEKEREDILVKEPALKDFIRPLIGSVEFIRGLKRFCIWAERKDYDYLKSFPTINKRFESVKKFRLQSKAPSTVDFAEMPYRFKQIQHREADLIIVPRVSSIRRKYIPCGFVGQGTIVLDSAQAIYSASPYMLGLISSHIHMVWVRATAGRLKSDYRYSSALSYNSFPIPSLSESQIEAITLSSFKILEVRESHLNKTLSGLYDPDKMPDDLRKAHEENDLLIESCYRKKPFESDEERLEHLFNLYEQMIEEEKNA